ncbi:MAG: 50S ribosomal protein L9 [Acidiferrobacteraceae bacterium]
MNVILLEKVRNLGDLGEEVRVRPGYGRNYLIPHGKAVRATSENKAIFEARRAELEKTQIKALETARTRADQMRDARLTLARRASEEGHLFGSVGPSDIVEAAEAAGLDIARSEIDLLEGPLKTLGEHEVNVVLHAEVEFVLHVTIVAEV